MDLGRRRQRQGRHQLATSCNFRAVNLRRFSNIVPIMDRRREAGLPLLELLAATVSARVPLAVQGIEQMVGDTDRSKSGDQHRRSAADAGRGVNRGPDTLIKRLNEPQCATLLFALRGLRHARIGPEWTVRCCAGKGRNLQS